MSKLLPIGRFAKMCRLSIKALRHYDDTKLLTPARIDENGYRYYERTQARRAISIALMRSLDLPLPTIREVLASESPETLASTLAAERARIERDLARSRQALSCVERLMRSGLLFAYDVTLREEPEQSMLSVRATTLPELHVEEGFRLVRELQDRFASAGLPFDPRLVCVLPEPPEEDTMILVMCAPRPPNVSDAQARLAGLEPALVGGETAAYTTHRGSYDDVGIAQHAVLAWIHEHGHETIGSAREIYLDDPAVTPLEACRTELVIPVRPARS